jgi:hypothetical protein
MHHHVLKVFFPYREHIHALRNMPPHVDIATLVNNLKNKNDLSSKLLFRLEICVSVIFSW